MPGPLLQTLEKLAGSGITEGFYLAGGTAISLKYGHRISEDLDFFTFPGKQIDTDLILSRTGKVEIAVSRKDNLIFFSEPDGVKVSFFKSEAPLVGDPETYRGKIYLASDMDIAAMKAVAIAQRGSKKDFFDLWFLMQKHGWSLGDLERSLAIKYPAWNFGIFLRALTYFEDADREVYSDIEPAWEEVKNFFRCAVKPIINHDRGINREKPPDRENDTGFSPDI